MNKGWRFALLIKMVDFKGAKSLERIREYVYNLLEHQHAKKLHVHKMLEFSNSIFPAFLLTLQFAERALSCNAALVFYLVSMLCFFCFSKEAKLT